jgi:thioredoxin-related protein
MKNELLLLLAVVLMSAGEPGGFDVIKEKAAREHKLILIRFTGSDWCMPCRAMEKRVFHNQSFVQYADSNLVVVEADFPKHTEQDHATRKLNKMLARKYQPSAAYPYTVLLDADGKKLEAWHGYGGQTVDFYIEQIARHIPVPNIPADSFQTAASAELR